VPPARLVPLDLNALIEEVLALYRTAGAPITLALASGLPRIEGDATQLRQVIHNLIGNAQEALVGHANARITVRTALAEIAESSGIVRGVRFAVEDNGPLRGEYTATCIRALCHHLPSGTGPGHGQESR
jgi:nitrogen fixation/metabolism regulation signal transduction histidine kinase